ARVAGKGERPLAAQQTSEAEPLPTSEVSRARLERLFGPSQVLGRPVALRQVHAVEIEEPLRFLARRLTVLARRLSHAPLAGHAPRPRPPPPKRPTRAPPRPPPDACPPPPRARPPRPAAPESARRGGTAPGRRPPPPPRRSASAGPSPGTSGRSSPGPR